MTLAFSFDEMFDGFASYCANEGVDELALDLLLDCRPLDN